MRVLYFAWLRERIGTSEEDVTTPPDVASVAQLVGWLRTRGPAYEAAFTAGNKVRCAVNQEFADPDDPVAATDEVAFFPPVTGG